MEAIIFHERLYEFKKVESLLVDAKVLMNPYAIESEETYKLENYLLNPGQRVSCLLDRNIVSYLIDLAKGIQLSDNFEQSRCHRLAAGLQAFFNAAKITSEPGLSYHEYIERTSVKAADLDLSYFRSADNIDANYYLDICLNKISSIPKTIVPTFESGELISFDESYRVKGFEFNIVVIKKALCIRAQCKNDYEAVVMLLDWMFEEYVFCAPGFYFMAIYFSHKRIPKMLKSQSVLDVRNAAWDLALLQQWISLANNDTGQAWYLATMDKAIREVANLMLIKSTETEKDYFERLQYEFSLMWGKKFGGGRKLFKRLTFWMENPEHPQRKAYRSKNNDNEYMLTLRTSVDEEYKRLATP
ncbi:hypothetical protein [Pseudoalteromonas luteoviolacea]|uniref:Uncharacterized protein n=1 Tax=Pseudoalteromonas luteoviolacea NCIMB 1942 TaxID=1365253 RepID=A0A167BMW6_9GAMM|nr:hypothetical protein [Pseudoalteromonas luteoviolacea]KZN46714.1 hypothetical protein N482_11600 [Pseudoalteromonas luteoviolacea NCIMB 1942]